MEGATTATVTGQNVLWVSKFSELDVAANSYVYFGTEGTVNLTCG